RLYADVRKAALDCLAVKPRQLLRFAPETEALTSTGDCRIAPNPECNTPVWLQHVNGAPVSRVPSQDPGWDLTLERLPPAATGRLHQQTWGLICTGVFEPPQELSGGCSRACTKRAGQSAMHLVW